MKTTKTHTIYVDDESLERIGECFAKLCMEAKNPCTTTAEKERAFDKVVFGKKILSFLKIKVNPPNNRNEVHLEVQN